jgi:hypothetical protein
MPTDLAFIVIPVKAGILAQSTRLAQQDNENGSLRHGQKPLRIRVVFCPWHPIISISKSDFLRSGHKIYVE